MKKEKKQKKIKKTKSNKMEFTKKQIENTVIKLGYKWFDGDRYDVNIVGIRNSKTKNKVTNKFDDLITITFVNEFNEWVYYEFPCTTDPGTHWVNNLLNEDGVAILKPGQYRGSHMIGLHQGKYEALTQKKPVTVYRDKDKDGEYDLDESKTETGMFGINIHRATANTSGTSTQVDKWSAGCVVIASNDDFKLFMEVCRKAKASWGNSFTLTLISSSDIV